MLVKLRVNQSTFDDITKRIYECGDPAQLSRLRTKYEVGHQEGGIDLSDVMLVVDPQARDK